MDDLVAFLRARYDEDERAAQAADTGRRWQAIVDAPDGPQVRVGAGGDLDDDSPEWGRTVNIQVWQCDDEMDGCPDQARSWVAEARHMAHHDPVRVMREAEAKRRILNECLRTLEHEDHGYAVAESVIRLLALPYAGQPGYREEWRPA